MKRLSGKNKLNLNYNLIFKLNSYYYNENINFIYMKIKKFKYYNKNK